MKISYSHLHGSFRQYVEDEAQHHIAKLNRLLKRYSPDLVQLHGVLEKQARRNEFTFALNLTLPTGVLHATGDGGDVRACVKEAFAEVEQQVKKHQEKLRKDYVWKRKRGRPPVRLSEAVSTD